MKFKDISIKNFRSIKFASFTDLTDMVIIAGPNGCGKSTIFDAIRLLKSVYGGYQQDEWQQWFSEFQISLDTKRPEMQMLFRDKEIPIEIEASIELSVEEKAYINNNLDDLINNYVWNQFVPNANNQRYQSGPAIAAQLEKYEPVVDAETKKLRPLLIGELASEKIIGRLIISLKSTRPIDVNRSVLLPIVFSQFDPQNLGIIDFHSPQRSYQREQIGGINLNIQTTEQQTSQHALYNYANKYTNIKSEMASSYVRELLIKSAGGETTEGTSLLNTLKELFDSFFPGKRFVGPVPTPDGKMRFPVITNEGLEHDINDLSSGEKEVLFGYLRLHNLSPKHSVLLIDEPELHLNPRLVQGLPQFYQAKLGSAKGNQIWLLTHSDAILREGLNTKNATVYHMLHSEAVMGNENQIRRLIASDEIERALIDLIGDLATYKPGSKAVIFEGGGNSEFDVYLVGTLFPGIIKKLNLISGGNKSQVKSLHEILEKTREKGVLSLKVYSIVDHDSDACEVNRPNEYTWDVYHIENYLLEPEFILKAIEDLSAGKPTINNVLDVEKNLVESAKEVIPSLVQHELAQRINIKMMSCISLNLDPSTQEIGKGLFSVANSSCVRMKKLLSDEFTESNLIKNEKEITQRFEKDLKTGDWKKTFRGRDVLKRFAGKYCSSVKYDYFRNIIIARMREDSFEPQGMKVLIQKIIDS